MKNRNQFGFSLVEIMIVAGALGGLALVALNLTKMTNRSTVKFTVDSEIQSLLGEMTVILNSPTKCLSTFSGKNALSDTTVTNVASKFYTKASGLAPAGGYGNIAMEISSFALSATSSELLDNTSYLVVNFKNKEILKSGASSTISKKIKLFVTVNASNAITACNSVAAGMSNEVWIKGAGTEISYSAGPVGIGTTAPTSTAALTVNGAISTGGTAVVMGNTTLSGRPATAIDIQTLRATSSALASGADSIAIGTNNSAPAPKSITIGSSNTITNSTDGGVLVGQSNAADGSLAIIYGRSNNAKGDNIVILGSGNNAYAPGDLILGRGNTAGVLGAVGSPPSHIVVGYSNVASADGSMIIGSGITNTITSSMQLGPSNSAKITILSTGRVGVGTASPTEALEVVGTVKMTDFQLTSDKNLKTQIESLNQEEEANKILKLNPIKFQWKKSGKADQGFIAQEVKKIFPQLVVGIEGVGQGLAIKYISLMSSIVSTIQKQFSDQEELEKILRQQEQQINDLEMENKAADLEIKELRKKIKELK